VIGTILTFSNCKRLTKQDPLVARILDLIGTCHEFSLRNEILACAQNAFAHPEI